MKLLLDIGNTRLKWGWFTDGQFVATGAASLAGMDIEATSAAIVDTGAGPRPDEIRVANVAGDGPGAGISRSLAARFGLAPVLARSAASGAGVRNGYRDPRQLGVDRWLAVCAAWQRHGTPVCIVDAGTATTIDLVGEAGDHLGGLILPGIELMQTALFRGTGELASLSARILPDSDGPGPESDPKGPNARLALGRDTGTAIRRGARQATACLLAAAVQASGGPGDAGPGALVVTGGAAPELLAAASPLLAGWPGLRVDVRPLLVLEGLALEPVCFDRDA